MAELLFSSRLRPTNSEANGKFSTFKDGPLENLLGRGRAKYKKKNSRRGKLNEKKILARQLTLKNIHAMA